jgi:hypothetical protein
MGGRILQLTLYGEKVAVAQSYPMKWDFPPGELSSKEVNYD